MLDLFGDIGWSVFTNVIQLAVGSLLTVLVYILFFRNKKVGLMNTKYSILLVFACSVMGLLLPIGTYGVIPLVLMLIAVGVNNEFVLPIVVSNAMFNLLAAYTDQSFSWKTGLGRIALALTAGIFFGLFSRIPDTGGIIRLKTKHFNKTSSNVLSDYLSYLSENINSLGGYLIVGTIIDALFHKYLYVGLVDAIFLNSNLSKTVTYFLRFDIANPYIQYTFNLFLNIACMAAFIRLLRLRGLFAFILTYSVLTLLFSIVAFI